MTVPFVRRGEQRGSRGKKLTVSLGPVIKCFVIPYNSTMELIINFAAITARKKLFAWRNSFNGVVRKQLLSTLIILFLQKNAILRCNSIANNKSKKKTHWFTWNEKCSDLNWRRRTDLFRRVCWSTIGVPELNFGLLAFPAGSPLAGAGGCSASEAAFTSENLVNLEWQSLPRVLQSPCIGSWPVYTPTAINREVKH